MTRLHHENTELAGSARRSLLVLCASACGGLIIARSLSFAGIDPMVRPALRSLQLGVEVVAAYILFVTLLGLVVRSWSRVAAAKAPQRVRLARGRHLLDHLTIGFVRSLLNGAVSSGLAVTLLTTTSGAATANTSRLTPATVSSPRSTVGTREVLAPGRFNAPIRGTRRTATTGHRLVRAGDRSSGQQWPVLPDPPVAKPSTPTSRATTTTTSTTSSLLSRNVPRSVTPPGHDTNSNRRTPAATEVERHGAGRPDVPRPVSIAQLAAPTTAGPAMPRTLQTNEHIVRNGESFWSIAEQVVHAADPDATEAMIARYWHRLIEHNRARLPVPGEPDLLFRGTRIETPPVA